MASHASKRSLLDSEESSFIKVLKDSDTQSAAKKPRPASTDEWEDILPYLRMYLVFGNEDVLKAYRESGNGGRYEAVKKKNQGPGFHELAAALYNDPDFNPVTDALPDLHPDFKSAIPLQASKAPIITPEKFEQELAYARADMMRVVAGWIRHRDGSSRNQKADNYQGSDNRQVFLRPEIGSHVLYGWHFLDKVGVIDYFLSWFLPNVGTNKRS